MPVRAAVSFTRPRGVLSKNLLTAERAVAAASSIRIAANFTVSVANVVSVFFVESVICDLVEATPPKHETLFQVQTNAFEE